MSENSAPALKEWFDEARFRSIAQEIRTLYPKFNGERFLEQTLPGLAELSLLQRLRRMTEGLHATLPADYSKALRILCRLAPRIQHGFVTLILPDYVAMYGRSDFEESMAALKFFTPFGSSEFGVRVFLRDDLHRTLRVMEEWSRDSDPHVRRLACEGCRPRLPWSFRLESLIANPDPVLPILENLRGDESLYVRKSVANHLNDITKDHPEWVLNRLASWPLSEPSTAWIAKRALRTLIKQGDRRALKLIGAGERPRVEVEAFHITPTKIVLGERLEFGFTVRSVASKPQRLVIDYAVHYVKKGGHTTPKVFKLKEIDLAPRESIKLGKRQIFRNFTTREHHAGRHRIEILINGELLASGDFELAVAKK